MLVAFIANESIREIYFSMPKIEKDGSHRYEKEDKVRHKIEGTQKYDETVCDLVATFNFLISNYFNLICFSSVLFSFTRMAANGCDVARKHISMFNLPWK